MSYLLESKIQELERMSEERMMAFIEKEGTKKTAATMVALLRSYRIAAHVANAGWKVAQEATAGQISAQSFQQLQKALSLYSPDNFHPFQSDLEFHCRGLEELYDFLSQWEGSSTAVLLEQLFERIYQLRGVLTHG